MAVVLSLCVAVTCEMTQATGHDSTLSDDKSVVHNSTSCNSTGQSAAVIVMHCCDLWDMMKTYVRARGGVRSEQCDPTDCMKCKEVETLLKHTEAAFMSRTIRGKSTIVAPDTDKQQYNIQVDMMTSKLMSELMVWAFIGRGFTLTQEGENDELNAFLQYDTIKHTISMIQPRCSFQKPVYDAMLTITIIAIIVILVLQTIKHSPQMKEHNNNATTPEKSTKIQQSTTSDTPAKIHKNIEHMFGVHARTSIHIK